MKREFSVTPTKSYATIENARKAVEKAKVDHISHFMMQCHNPLNEKHFGRYFPVFVGREAIEQQVHFIFNVVA